MDIFQFVIRWAHVISGITWIGFLYFFNFVNVPLQAALDDAGKKAVNPKLQPRALWWFRWGAMSTLLTGLLLYALVYMYDPAQGFTMSGMHQPTPWIMMGMTFGVIMWFNVWFIIWPTNRKLMRGEIAAEKQAASRRKVYLASRTNTYLSGPMLFGMLGANHGAPNGAAGLVMALAIGFAGIFVAIFHSYKFGQTV